MLINSNVDRQCLCLQKIDRWKIGEITVFRKWSQAFVVQCNRLRVLSKPQGEFKMKSNIRSWARTIRLRRKRMDRSLTQPAHILDVTCLQILVQTISVTPQICPDTSGTSYTGIISNPVVSLIYGALPVPSPFLDLTGTWILIFCHGRCSHVLPVLFCWTESFSRCTFL